MNLREDQRALLQLVCERGQSYEDLAGLLETDLDGVRAQARAALTELAGTDPDAEVGLSDYLLGQSDPIGRADAVRYLRSDPETLELAHELAAKLRVIAPGAELPKLPQPQGGRRPTAVSADSSPAPQPDGRPAGSGLSTHQARWIAGLTAAGLIVLFIALAIAGVFSAGDDATAEPVVDEREIVQLEPRRGSGVSGQLEFTGTADDQPFVAISIDGLSEPEGGEFYLLWLRVDDELGIPFARPEPLPNGTVRDSAPLPGELLALAQIFQEASIDLTLTDEQPFQRAVRRAQRNEEGAVLPITGRVLASGGIPVDPQIAEALEALEGLSEEERGDFEDALRELQEQEGLGDLDEGGGEGE